MSLLDILDRSQVNVRLKDIVISDDMFEFDEDKDFTDLCDEYRPGRVCIGINASHYDFEKTCERVKENAPVIIEKLFNIPQVVDISKFYVYSGDGYAWEMLVYIDLDVRTPYEAVRVFMSIISVFCTYGDGWVYDEDLSGSRMSAGFITKYVDFEHWKYAISDYLACCDIIERIVGREISVLEWKKCIARICKIYVNTLL